MGSGIQGRLPKKALENFIAGRPVTCKQVDYDARTNRPVVQCFAGEDDLQACGIRWLGLVLWTIQRTVCAGGEGSGDAASAGSG